MIAEFGSDEEETGFENAEGGGDGDGVEVFDFEGLNFFVLVLDGDFVQISLFALEEEEEVAL